MNNFFQKRKFKIKKFKHQNLKEMLHLNINDESTKFGNKWVMVDGFKFQSIKEACYYQYLRGEKKIGKIKDFYMQVPFPIIVKNKLLCTYIADFVVYYYSGVVEVVDPKGFRTETFKRKKRLLKKHNNIIIKEV